MRMSLMAVALITLPLSITRAQERIQYPKGELRAWAGANIPTGTARDAFKSMPAFGAQYAFEVRPQLHLVGSAIRVAQDSKLATAEPGLSFYQYDLGVEWARRHRLSGPMSLEPFVGAGYGARSYSYSDTAFPNETFAAGYAATGVEFRSHAMAVRIEGRSYLSGYREPMASRGWRSAPDFMLGLCVALHLP